MSSRTEETKQLSSSIADNTLNACGPRNQNYRTTPACCSPPMSARYVNRSSLPSQHHRSHYQSLPNINAVMCNAKKPAITHKPRPLPKFGNFIPKGHGVHVEVDDDDDGAEKQSITSSLHPLSYSLSLKFSAVASAAANLEPTPVTNVPLQKHMEFRMSLNDFPALPSDTNKPKANAALNNVIVPNTEANAQETPAVDASRTIIKSIIEVVCAGGDAPTVITATASAEATTAPNTTNIDNNNTSNTSTNDPAQACETDTTDNTNDSCNTDNHTANDYVTPEALTAPSTIASASPTAAPHANTCANTAPAPATGGIPKPSRPNAGRKLDSIIKPTGVFIGGGDMHYYASKNRSLLENAKVYIVSDGGESEGVQKAAFNCMARNIPNEIITKPYNAHACAAAGKPRNGAKQEQPCPSRAQNRPPGFQTTYYATPAFNHNNIYYNNHMYYYNAPPAMGRSTLYRNAPAPPAVNFYSNYVYDPYSTLNFGGNVVWPRYGNTMFYGMDAGAYYMNVPHMPQMNAAAASVPKWFSPNCYQSVGNVRAQQMPKSFGAHNNRFAQSYVNYNEFNNNASACSNEHLVANTASPPTPTVWSSERKSQLLANGSPQRDAIFSVMANALEANAMPLPHNGLAARHETLLNSAYANLKFNCDMPISMLPEDRQPKLEPQSHNSLPSSRSSVQDDYGLQGLAAMLRRANTQPELVPFTFGVDIDSIGIDMASTKPIHPIFMSPLLDKPCNPLAEPHEENTFSFTPALRVVLRSSLLHTLPEDTLFYFFYCRVADGMQKLAGAELHRRCWRFHKVDRVWIFMVTRQSDRNVEQQNRVHGSFICFDPCRWQKRVVFKIIDLTDLELPTTTEPGSELPFNAPVNA